MTTLTGEVNSKAPKGAFLTSLTLQAAMIFLLLSLSLFSVPTLTLDRLPMIPLLRPVVIAESKPEVTPTDVKPTNGGGPNIPSSSVPRVYRPFVSPRTIPTSINTTFVDSLPPGVDIVYGKNPGTGIGIGNGPGMNNNDFINFAGPPAIAPPIVASIPPTPKVVVTVGGEVQASKVLFRPAPAYPALAKNARVSGKVVLDAIIAADGSIQSLHVRSGPPLLAPAAIDAVRQWRYTPTLLNKQPVEVQTTIEVNFVLANF